jgi:wyosine [tRNA(Phe)-imidazoG37] synthetase (radical SAM superfamily)
LPQREISVSIPSSPDPLFACHPRSFAENLYVYPVLSRRAGGISIGVNLSRDQFCNFRCIYCQVVRDPVNAPEFDKKKSPSTKIELPRLADELNWTLEQYVSGGLFETPRFSRTPSNLRRLNDIALSGDGEPTAYCHFAEAVGICAEARRRHRLDDAKLVLITNASLLHRPAVQEGLAILDQNNGEIWAKLDAGTEAYYAQVARSAIGWRQILDNLLAAAKVRPIVVQTLFMRIREQRPPAEEIAAYCERLREILAGGGRIKLVQIHTIARHPAEAYAAPLTHAEVDTLADQVRRATNLRVAAFYGES